MDLQPGSYNRVTPNFVASIGAFQVAGAVGYFQRRLPTGGYTYGIPLKGVAIDRSVTGCDVGDKKTSGNREKEARKS